MAGWGGIYSPPSPNIAIKPGTAASAYAPDMSSVSIGLHIGPRTIRPLYCLSTSTGTLHQTAPPDISGGSIGVTSMSCVHRTSAPDMSALHFHRDALLYFGHNF